MRAGRLRVDHVLGDQAAPLVEGDDLVAVLRRVARRLVGPQRNRDRTESGVRAARHARRRRLRIIRRGDGRLRLRRRRGGGRFLSREGAERRLHLRLLRGCRAFFQVVGDVGLGHPSAGAGAGDFAQIEAVLLGDVAPDRRNPDAVGRRCGGRRFFFWRRRRWGRYRGCAGLFEAGQGRPDRNHRPFLRNLLDQHARAGRGNLGIRLVGRDLDQRLVQLHPLPRLRDPAHYRPLHHRFAELGHHDRSHGCAR